MDNTRKTINGRTLQYFMASVKIIFDEYKLYFDREDSTPHDVES